MHYNIPKLPAAVIALLCSLIPALTKAESKVEKLYESASELMAGGDLAAAQQQFDKAFAIAGVKNDPVYPLLLNEQATLMTWRGERRKAINAKRAVIPMLKRFNDTELDVSVYSDLGLLYHRSNMTDSAIVFYEKADSACRVLNDPGWTASVTQSIGVMYYNLGRYADAKRYFERAAEHGMKANDDYSIVCSHQLLSAVNSEMGDTAAAGRNARIAWQRAKASKNESLQLRCIPSLYGYFEATGRRDSVDYYMAIGDTLYHHQPNNSVISLGYVLARARMHYARKEYAEALKWYEIQMRSPMQSERGKLYSSIADCYRETGRYKEACIYMDSARMWADSMANINAAARLEEFNVKYGTLEREMENRVLQLNLLQRERMLLIIALAAVILAVIASAIYFRQRRTRRAMKELERTRELESARSYIDGLEDERKRFAKELHDGVANDLLGLKMKIEAGNDDRRSLSDLIDTTRKTVRRISHDLMPPEFDNMTPVEVMRSYLAATAADSGIQIDFISECVPQLPIHIGREIYRITQEYVINLLNHGNATLITVSFKGGDGDMATLTITDNSTVALSHDTPSTGIGLRTMADRARSLNAGTSLETAPDGRHIFTLTFHT